MLKNLKSDLLCLIGLALLIGLGFIKVIVPAYPHGATLGGCITLILGWYGKRLIQKRPEYRENYEETRENS